MLTFASAEEKSRAAALLDAQSKAATLFTEIERDLLRPGVGEKAVSDAIHALGKERHGVRTHWHKRVVRGGPNTLRPFEDNPPDRVLDEGDIVVVDLGPVFAEWEADFGRTYVLGKDAEKERLRDALEPMWQKVKAAFDERRDEMTGGELYELAKGMAERDGWTWGADIAGHTVGDFPHERIPGDKISMYITEGNDKVMLRDDTEGHQLHWILEVHLRHPSGKYGGFYEQLLTCD